MCCLKMKANNGSGNNPDRDEWETPKELFSKLNKQYRFNYDCCATYKNNKCGSYTNDFERVDCFNLSICWMNPPFSKARQMFEHFFKVVNSGVAIYRCDNFETKIWQEVIFLSCDCIFIPKGRVVYEGMEGNGSRFPSALIGIGIEPPKYLDGVCLSLLHTTLGFRSQNPVVSVTDLNKRRKNPVVMK